ncbi:hypothetical protein TWF481_000346 [Arthrobotrys musiformis]|uniref:Uncharacterized protein n=1 Tax=Arthrobotrys musiformis TaxID=47236 RepID=A0AAV9WN90_9PEZI
MDPERTGEESLPAVESDSKQKLLPKDETEPSVPPAITKSEYPDTYDESPETSSQESTKITTSFINRLGSLVSVLFLSSSIFSIGCMGWFAFLWWGTADNYVWRTIVINDWAVRAISLPSSFFRMAVTLQASQCLSMLAALAIEKSIIPLPDVSLYPTK